MTDDVLRLRALLERSSLRPSATAELHLVCELLAVGKPVDGKRPSLSVVFVLDASGSMQGQPLVQVQRSVHLLLDLLSDEDKVGIVAFSARATEVAPLTALTADARRHLARRVEGISANGGTNLEAGLLEAQRIVGKRAPHERQVLVLLTDGQPNAGATTLKDLSSVIEKMRPDVALATLGYGPGHAVDLLAGLATAGGGSYWYIPDPDQAGMEFARAMGAQGDMVADAIEVALVPADGVEVAEVYDKKPRFTKHGIVVAAPDLRENAKHIVVARLKVDAPRERGPHELVKVRVMFRAAGGNTGVAEASAALAIVDTEPALNTEAHVMAELALAERARKEARAAADQANFDVAAATLRVVIARLQNLPGYKAMDGSALSEAVEQLIDEVTAYAQRPSKERYHEFKATSLGLDLAQGAVHAADVKMTSDRSQRWMASAQGAKLEGEVIIKYRGQEWRQPLEPEMTIGRVPGCGITVPSSQISRRHTRLMTRDGKVVVTDLGSTNGSFVNGKRVTGIQVLAEGDKVYVGDVEIQVVLKPKA